MNDMARWRQLLMDHAVGQASAQEEELLRGALQHSEALRREQVEIERTIGFLRSVPDVRPSPSFRARLLRRLDRLDGAPAPGRWQQVKDSAAFHTALFSYRLQTVRSLRLQLLAAVVILAVGLVLSRLGSPEGVSRVATSGGPRPEAAKEGGELLPEAGSVPPWVVPEASSEGESPHVAEMLEGFRPRLDPPSDAPRVETAEGPLPEGRRESSSRTRNAPLLLAEQPSDARRGAPQGPAREPAQLWQRQRPSVQRAMHWLIRQQRADGSWSARDGEADLGVGVTALSLLSFVRAGFVSDEPRGQVVSRAVAYLRSSQDLSGCYGRTRDVATTHFNHATACLALLEAQGARGATGLLDAPLGVELQHALDYLEIVLYQLFLEGVPDRCSGHNVAWAALAMATALQQGNYVLSPQSREQVEEMLLRLRRQPTLSDADTALAATWQTVHSTFQWDLPEPEDDDWTRAIGKILARPARQEASLRFLVAAALFPSSSDGEVGADRRHRLWNSFYQELVSSLEALQEPASGAFLAHKRWLCFDGGDVYETALDVLTLQLPDRMR